MLPFSKMTNEKIADNARKLWNFDQIFYDCNFIQFSTTNSYSRILNSTIYQNDIYNKSITYKNQRLETVRDDFWIL